MWRSVRTGSAASPRSKSDAGVVKFAPMNDLVSRGEIRVAVLRTAAIVILVCCGLNTSSFAQGNPLRPAPKIGQGEQDRNYAEAVNEYRDAMDTYANAAKQYAAAVEAYRDASKHSKVNFSLELSGVALAIIAIFALLFARRQLGQMRAATAAQNNQVRATVLLSLDERWESELMLAARKSTALKQRVRTQAVKNWPADSESELRNKIGEVYANEFQTLRAGDDTAQTLYLQLFQLCGFFETVGYVSRAGYIPETDIIGLFGNAIIDTGSVFTPHIAKLLGEDGANPELYSSFLSLYQRTVQRVPSISGASA